MPDGMMGAEGDMDMVIDTGASSNHLISPIVDRVIFL